MPNDRAAVAREVLTEALVAMKRAGYAEKELWELQRHMDAVAPAPPETVTVTVRVFGSDVMLSRGETAWTSDAGHYISRNSFANFLADRIAADARRIAELERESNGIDAATVLNVAAVVYGDDFPPAWQTTLASTVAGIKDERDKANARIAELTGHAMDLSVELQIVQKERDEARRALEEKGEGLGKINEAKQARAEEPADRRVTVDAAPAPIPLGATVEVEGSYESPYTRDEGAWNDACGCVWRDGGSVPPLITALYHARHDADCNKHKAQHMHDLYDSLGMEWGCNPFPLIQQLLYPVAGRETVERVAKAIDEASRSYSLRAMARAALTAAGFTIQEGA